MSKTLLILPFVAILLNSCFIADEVFAEAPPEREKSLQEKSEYSASKYTKNSNKQSEYKSLGFSPIKIHKPIELSELDRIKVRKKNYPDSLYLDTLLAQKINYIRENNIERTLELDHFYTLIDDKGIMTAFEDRVIMNDTLSVKFIKPLILLEIPDEYEDVLIYYFYEYTIFLASSYESSKELSKNFYQFFKARLEEIEGVTNKSNFLWHVLQLCKKVKDTGEFNQQSILEEIVEEFIETERKDIQNYQNLKFSSLFEKTDENSQSKTSYYFFHKFIGQFGETIDTNVVMVEFSPYYEIDQIYQMDRPFDAYFK